MINAVKEGKEPSGASIIGYGYITALLAEWQNRWLKSAETDDEPGVGVTHTRSNKRRKQLGLTTSARRL